MSLLGTLQYITAHPFNRHHKARALAAFLGWQLRTRLTSGEQVVEWVDGARIILRRGETGLTGNLYCGLHEFADMAYVLHVAGADDLFVDVGANVGSYTVLACAARGARGICIEPVPSTFTRLSANLEINTLAGRVEALNIGLGAEDGELLFTGGHNTMNHVLARGESEAGALRVPVRTLEGVLAGRVPTFMKIDVEGFEAPVLRGALTALGQGALHSVIMELNGMGARYGFDESAILALMRECGFATYTYEPYTRQLVSLEGKNHASGNTIFIRDVEQVRSRIARAAHTTIFGRRL
jgi:FkbM family methyltransferase